MSQSKSSRVDADAFQADTEAVSQSEVVSVETELLQGRQISSCQPQHQKAILDFILYSRNLFQTLGRSWDLESVKQEPLEEDEGVVEFLSRYGYEVNEAKFRLLCETGMGQDAANLRRDTGKVKHEDADFSQLRGGLFQRDKPLLGHLLSSASYEQQGEDDLEAGAGAGALAGAGEEEASVAGGEGDRETGSAASVAEESTGTASVAAAAARKRWTALSKRAVSMASKCVKSDRPALAEVLALLEEAAGLGDHTALMTREAAATLTTALNSLTGNLLSGREWVAEVQDLLSSRGVKPATPQELRALLTEAESLPLTVPAEEAYLRRVLREAEALRTQARTILRPDNEDESRPAEEKTSLAAAEQVVAAAGALQVSLDTVKRLEAVCAEARTLSHRALVIVERTQLLRTARRALQRTDAHPAYKLTEVEALLAECEGCLLALPFTQALRGVLTTVEAWRTEVQGIEADDKKVVALQRIEQLLAEGERFPFDVTSELEVLQNKRTGARLWLDKFKRVFPGKARQPNRKQEDKGAEELPVAGNGKLNLSDVKALVAEGEQLLQRDEDAGTLGRAAAASNKELSKAQSVVGVAEEWVERVRGVLSEGDLAAAAAELEELLEEAEDMPVYMQEVALLRLHLDSIEWSHKAKKKLAATAKPRQTDVAKLLKDLAKIRSALPEDYPAESLLSFPEERFCVDALAAMDRWNAQVKRLTSGARRDVDYERLRALYLEGLAIPMNIEAEMRFAFQALSDAEEWIAQHQHQLRRAGIPVVLRRTEPGNALSPAATQEDEAEEETEGSLVMETQPEVAVTEGGDQEEGEAEQMEVVELERLNDSASHLVVVFPELLALRGKIAAIHAWLDDINNLCPRKLVQYAKKRPVAKARRLTEEDLDELLLRGAGLGVNVSGDIARVSDLVEASKSYNASCVQSLSDISSRLNLVLDDLINVTALKSTMFPFLEGVFQSSSTPAAVAAEQECYSGFLAVQGAVQELVRRGEDSVLHSAAAARVDLCAGVLKWVAGARQVLGSRGWGDVSRDLLQDLTADISTLLTPDCRETLAARFSNCGFDAELVLSEWCLEMPEELNSPPESVAEEHTQRRATRKPKVFEGESVEPPVKRKRGPKSAAEREEIAAAAAVAGGGAGEVAIVGRPAKRRKKTEEGGDSAVVVETKESEVTAANTVESEEPKPVPYEPCVAQLLARGESYAMDDALLPFFALADLWLRLVEMLQRRLLEVDAWTRSWRALQQSCAEGAFASEDTRGEWDRAVARLMEWSRVRCVASARRGELEALLTQIGAWGRQAESVKSKSQQLTPDQLRDLIKTGEAFNLYLEPLDALRAAHRAAKTWMLRFQKLTSDRKGARTEDLEELVADSESLLVNVEEYTNQLNLDTKKYCLCRQAYHSEMVGCDECEEWYHFLCIGMSQSQADKVDKYLCIRCSLRSSFLNATILAAQSVNKWMSPIDIIRAREQRLTKVSRQVSKQEKDILRIQAELNRLVMLAKSRHENESAAHSLLTASLMEGSVPPPALPPFSLQGLLVETSDIGNLIRKYTTELEMHKGAFKKSQAEEKEVIAQNSLEMTRSTEIVVWMHSVKEILWPSRPEHHALGQPLTSGELPDAVRRAAFDAEKTGISKVEDVVYVIQCFLWMGWCFRCLHSLRGPITTNELRRLVNASRSIKFYDDRIVKILISILTRSNAWKQKCRKVLKSYSQRNDLTKLTPLILEANSIPLFSRLKLYCQRVFDEVSGSGSGSGSSSQQLPPPPGSSSSPVNGAKRVPKISSAYAGSVTSLPPSLMQAANQTSAGDLNSTDEDESESSLMPVYSKISLAPAGAGLWPPALGFLSKDVYQQQGKKPEDFLAETKAEVSKLLQEVSEIRAERLQASTSSSASVVVAEEDHHVVKEDPLLSEVLDALIPAGIATQGTEDSEAMETTTTLDDLI